MRILGTQRVKQLAGPGEAWFRQRLLETSPGTVLPGMAYFDVPVPIGTSVERIDALLFTPQALVVVIVRSLPWFRRGLLHAPLSGPWTVEGMDARLGAANERNPGERATRLVFALRDHVRSAGVGARPVRGLVCIAGPRITVRQERSARRLSYYRVCGASVEALRRVLRPDRAAPERGWTQFDVLTALEALNVHHDVPSTIELAAEGFAVDHVVPVPRRARAGVSPELALAGMLAVPAAAAVLAVGWIGEQIWQAVPPPSAVAGLFEAGVSGARDVGGLRFERHDEHTASDCATHASGKAQQVLAVSRCRGLDQARYSTVVDGAAVEVSVVTVRMADDGSARALADALARPDGGVVGDPVGAALTEERAAAQHRNNAVVVARSRYADRAGKQHSSGALDHVSLTALRLAT
jgi:hypothetical protein